MPGGPGWLQWALAEPGPVLEAPDEAELLARIQSGLYGTSLMNVQPLDLAAHPRRLMRLDDQTAKLAAQAAVSEDPDDVRAAWKALSADGLSNFSELASGRELLSTLGVADRSLFAAMDLGDLTALSELAGQDPTLLPAGDDTLRRKAADFAVPLVQSCAEFVDAYRFFCGNVKTGGKGSKNGRAEAVSRLWERLAPLVDGFLETMSLPPGLADADLCARIETAVYGGLPLGFTTRARALRVLTGRAGGGTDDDNWTATARDALMDARCMVRHGNMKSVTLSQDGMRRHVEYAQDTTSLVLEYGPAGLVTIAEFTG